MYGKLVQSKTERITGEKFGWKLDEEEMGKNVQNETGNRRRRGEKNTKDDSTRKWNMKNQFKKQVGSSLTN